MEIEADMNITDTEAPTAVPPPQPQVQPQLTMDEPQGMDLSDSSMSVNISATANNRDKFREIPVKVHVRRPERDNWSYVGRAVVTQESFGQGSRIVVRATSSRKVVTAFHEGASLQAEKRGNFVVVSCVEGGRVISWSLNALNNSETLRLLAIIELSCYTCKHIGANPEIQGSHMRRVARVIKDDRRKRHKRRKDQEAMVTAFAKTGIDDMNH
ncbi:uncharacterized protein PHACADRAFT_134317 [Phanerochaete carnosa HHB-10118-sp]|uniref:Uncharacterized protein n=1 Tax=Phanerochaete carnosa (strain HHB-10118-sp) TaxID=650164 RepID=K5WAY0_PHACS|nr:uncharacterized protein PHACADRAFT_134317 [Phanerochaete carnosa HHB-10118-sp]EKM61113.1 hypothetical protein PHACADRAFT_134317 [Phanerochaete carnosa HHB-10118-sp]